MKWGIRILLVFVLVGCDRLTPPAPVEYRTASPTASAVSLAPSSKPVVAPEDGVLIQKGDTLYSLSKRYQVPISEVIQTNSLRPPYTIKVGQRLVIPKPRVHVVGKGDTIYSLSRAYRVDMSQLTKINGINKPYAIYPGQTLKIPSSVNAAQAPASSQASAPVKTSSPLPQVKTKTAVPKKYIPPKRSASKFSWPVKGKIVSSYGPKAGGLHNDGINIAAARGTVVKAAENGIIAYTGNQIEGYGNLILIKHDGGWTTAYAHINEISVQKGQQVKVGQKIGTVGSTGSVSTPQLHFEIRKGRQAVNPSGYIK